MEIFYIKKLIIQYRYITKQSFYQYEYFKDRKRYGQQFYENLYLYQTYAGISLIDELKVENSPEGQVLTDSLFRLFKREVEQEGSKFVMLTLPTVKELTELRLGQNIAYQDFLDNLAKNQNYLSTFEIMSSETNLSSLFAKGFHYSAKGNQILAKELTNYLTEKKLIEN